MKRCPSGQSYASTSFGSHGCVPNKLITLRKRARKLGLKTQYDSAVRFAHETEDRPLIRIYGHNPRRYMETRRLDVAEDYIKQLETWKRASCKKLKSTIRGYPKDSRGRDIIKWELDNRCGRK